MHHGEPESRRTTVTLEMGDAGEMESVNKIRLRSPSCPRVPLSAASSSCLLRCWAALLKSGRLLCLNRRHTRERRRGGRRDRIASHCMQPHGGARVLAERVVFTSGMLASWPARLRPRSPPQPSRPLTATTQHHPHRTQQHHATRLATTAIIIIVRCLVLASRRPRASPSHPSVRVRAGAAFPARSLLHRAAHVARAATRLVALHDRRA